MNGEKASPKFRRTFYDKNENAYCCHAEMRVIEKAKATSKDVLYVARFKNDKTLTMAKPCKWCIEHIKRAGIKKVYYSNWNGTWEKLNVA